MSLVLRAGSAAAPSHPYGFEPLLLLLYGEGPINQNHP